MSLRGTSKKDYQAIASAACKYAVPEGFVREIARHFAEDNLRFDTERFVAATKRC